MNKKISLFAIIILLFVAVSPAFPQAHSVSRNNQDTVDISKITPRSLAYLLKPVNIPFHMEISYDLKSTDEARVVVLIYKIYTVGISGKSNAVEDKKLRKVYKIKKGKGKIIHITPPLAIHQDEKVSQVLAVVSLVDARGTELAFSSSKNLVAGSYTVYLEKKSPDGDYIFNLGTKPAKNSEIKVGQIVKFEISLKYSLKSQSIAYIDVLFMDVNNLGTGQCWNAVTVTVPNGIGKVILKPEIYFADNLAGQSMGIGILYWLKPLENTIKYLPIRDYFLRKF